MENLVPLEKQLLHIDLRKGLNERDRPETADPSTVLTRVENLVQDQTGSWIKRPGTSVLGSSGSITPTKVLRTKSGLGAVSSDGRLVPYLEGPPSSGSWKLRDTCFLPLFTGNAELVLSSGPHVSPKIDGMASSTKFHAMIVEMGLNSTGGAARHLVIYDRNAGSVAESYDMERIRATTSVVVPKIAFVGDRYLHVHTFSGDAAISGNVYSFVIDTSAALPTSEAAITTTSLFAGAGAVSFQDISVSHTNSRSYLLFSFGATTTCLSMNNSGSLINSATLAGGLQIYANDESTAGLWWITSTQLGKKNLTTFADVIALANHSGGSAIAGPQICADKINNVYCLSEAAVTFGGTTINRITVRRTTASDGTTFSTHALIDGWKLASAPLAPTHAQKVFAQLVKESSVTSVAHVLANVTFGDEGEAVASALTYNSLRIATTLEPFVGAVNSRILRYLQYKENIVCPAVPVQTVARGYGYAVYSLNLYGHKDISSHVFGGASYISGGTQSVFTGDSVRESGFIDYPKVNTQVGAAGNPSGAYKYIAVHKRVDETGAVTYSRTSEVSSITLTSQRGTVTISPCSVTNSDPVQAVLPLTVKNIVELYRTKAGGTQYYLCASSQVGTPASGLSTQVLALTAGPFWTVTDNLSDTTLASEPLMFRQPGTANSPVDRYPPPCSNILCQHKDRLFTTDPYGARVYYSSFFVDGECAWYNPAFSFFVHGGSGPITGLVSMDGRLFVFKRDSVFVVDGDGPSEGGVAGNEFSPPQRLATPYGCTDHRSIAVTSDGIVYRSDRGIELLTRSLQVKWIGERVFQTVDAHTESAGTVIDTSGRVHFALSASDSGLPLQTGVSGVVLVYDSPGDCWSLHKFIGGETPQDISTAELLGLGEVVLYAWPGGNVRYADTATGLDALATYVSWTIETAWIKVGQQARARFSKILFLAKKLAGANHKITAEVAFQYVDSYTQSKVWEPLVINAAAIEELILNINRPEVLAVRFRIADSAPTDTGTYPIGTGRGCDILGISVEIAPKTGAPKQIAAQKG